MSLVTTAVVAAAGLGMAKAALALRHYASVIEPSRIEIPDYDVFSPYLPRDMEGFTICQLSDLHITASPRNQTAITRAVRSVQADLFALTGDMIYRQSGTAAFFDWFDALGEAVRPAVAILGNAEHKLDVRTEDIVRGLAERDIPLLINENICFPVRNETIQIVGTDDPHTYHSDFPKAYAGSDPKLWTLLLCHSPDGARELDARRADLMLCGHTHGGAVRVPPFGALVHGTTHVKGLVSGWYEYPVLSRRARCNADDTLLYVSRGLGMSRWQLRINCRPEMPLFRLRRGALQAVARTGLRIVSA